MLGQNGDAQRVHANAAPKIGNAPSTGPAGHFLFAMPAGCVAETGRKSSPSHQQPYEADYWKSAMLRCVRTCVDVASSCCQDEATRYCRNLEDSRTD